MAARTAGIDKNEEIAPLSPYVCFYTMTLAAIHPVFIIFYLFIATRSRFNVHTYNGTSNKISKLYIKLLSYVSCVSLPSW